MGEFSKEDMLTDKEYTNITEKIILNNCESSVANHILSDPIKFGRIVKSVMTADWKWNGTGNKYGYRKQCALWAIKRILKEMRKKTKEHNYSDWDSEELEGAAQIIDKNGQNFMDEIDWLDYTKYIQKKLDESSLLNDLEKKTIAQKIIHQKEIKQISQEMNMSDPSIRYAFNSGMKKLGGSLLVS